jgi:hypothetical protein
MLANYYVRGTGVLDSARVLCPRIPLGKITSSSSCVFGISFKRSALEFGIDEQNEVTFEMTDASFRVATCRGYEKA